MASASQWLVTAPVLETERLRLRGHRVEDFAHCAAMWSDPQVTRFIRPQPFTQEEVWARLLRYVGHWTLLGFGFWLVEEKHTGDFMGEAGFANYKRGIEPLGDMPEIGWVLAAHAHGKGYATEAVGAVVAWGDQHFGAAATACIIDQQNLASIRIAEKHGYRAQQIVSYKGEALMLYVREAVGKFEWRGGSLSR